MNRRLVLSVAVLAVSTAACEGRRRATATADRICRFYTEALDRHPNDHAAAEVLVEEKRRQVFDHDPRQPALHWSSEVLKGWIAIGTADASERYRLFGNLVESETGNSGWQCPAMEAFWQVEVAQAPSTEQRPDAQDASPEKSSTSTGSARMGSPDKGAIADVVARHRAAVRLCYEERLLAAPDLHGKVVVYFRISADGSVESVEIREATIADAKMKDCIIAVVRRMVFPSPKGGSVVEVVYPFIFRTTD